MTRENLNERLLSVLIGLARATEGNEELVTEEITRVFLEGLEYLDMAETSFTEHPPEDVFDRIKAVKKALVPNCFSCASPCGRTADYEMKEFWETDKERIGLKLEILDKMRNQAISLRKNEIPEEERAIKTDVCYEALIVLGWNGSRESLLRVLKKL